MSQILGWTRSKNVGCPLLLSFNLFGCYVPFISLCRFGTPGLTGLYISYAPDKYQISHRAPGFEPQTSEVGGECVIHYNTKPPLSHVDALWFQCRMLTN